MIQHTGDEMRGKRSGFTTAGKGEFHEQRVNNPTGNFSEGIAVEEKKRSGAMALKQKVQRFTKRQDLGVERFPALPDCG